MTINALFKSLLLIAVLKTTSLVSQTNWTKDATNPVLRRDTVIANLPNDLIVISDGWVLKEGTTYKMWYTCGGINYPADTLLRSRLCFAESTDGINWNKYAGNPILDVSYTGGWDSLGVETASVIIDNLAPSAERYKMWYAGQYFNSYRYDIGYATSPDGYTWTKHSSPVLSVGSSAEWDNGFLEGPSVIKDGSTYKMWYCGYDAIPDGNGTDGHANIGYATSLDGINWVKDASNPIFTTGVNSWDSVYVQDPHVIKENGMYYMWYGGNNVETYGQKVGYAWSTDGINWTKYAANPVLSNGSPGEWDSNTASFPSVLNDNGIYKMWYTGKDVDPIPSNLDYYWEIGYAVDSTLVSLATLQLDEHELIVYPNPTNDVLYLNVSEGFKNTSYMIIDQMGKIVCECKSLKKGIVEIETGNLSAGFYTLYLMHDEGLLNTRIIINH